MDKFWDDHGRKCLACGKCNFTWPTCRCFTISDEPNPDLRSGKSYKEIPFIVSRMCGVCPIIHNITSVQALEKA